MRILFIFMMTIILTAPAYAKKDTDLSCAELNAEMNKLENTITSASNARRNAEMTEAAGDVAKDAADVAGYNSSSSLFGSISKMANSFTKNSETKARSAAADAEKRIIKLETIAEMKECN